MAQFSQGLRLNLADALSGYVELFTHLFKRVIRIHVDTEAHPEHLSFSSRQARQNIARGISQTFFGGHIQRRAHSCPFTKIRVRVQKVPEVGVFVITDGGLG